MNTSVIALSVAALLAFGSAAAVPAPAGSPGGAKPGQQSKMSTCAAASKGKKGDDYRNAMRACLGTSSMTPTPAPAAQPAHKPRPATTPATATRGGSGQQSKMSTCAAANKGRKGDEYKNAMNACLRASVATSAM